MDARRRGWSLTSMLPWVALRVGAEGVSLVDKRLGDIARQTGKADIQPGAKGVKAVHQTEIHFRIDRETRRKGDFLRRAAIPIALFEACRTSRPRTAARVRAGPWPPGGESRMSRLPSELRGSAAFAPDLSYGPWRCRAAWSCWSVVMISSSGNGCRQMGGSVGRPRSGTAASGTPRAVRR